MADPDADSAWASSDGVAWSVSTEWGVQVSEAAVGRAHRETVYRVDTEASDAAAADDAEAAAC
jgi:hypothetical protein